MQRPLGILLATAALLSLGGCVYGPDYYQRPGVVYDDGTAAYAPTAGYAYGYYAPGYYADPWCCYGSVWPWFGLNFYGGYYGHWRGGHGWHGGGNWRGRGYDAAPRSLPGTPVAPRGSDTPQGDRVHRH
ncbi:MAG: hypothetical protein ACREPN_03150 [Rudaea sp.]